MPAGTRAPNACCFDPAFVRRELRPSTQLIVADFHHDPKGCRATAGTLPLRVIAETTDPWFRAAAEGRPHGTRQASAAAHASRDRVEPGIAQLLR